MIYRLNGKEVTREEFLKGGSKLKELGQGAVPMMRGKRSWPLHSDALGCLPRQEAELKQWYKDRGVTVNYDSEYRMILESQAHRNKVLKASNIRDNDAGYGDYAGEHG